MIIFCHYYLFIVRLCSAVLLIVASIVAMLEACHGACGAVVVVVVNCAKTRGDLSGPGDLLGSESLRVGECGRLTY
jgi:hypothetical protein